MMKKDEMVKDMSETFENRLKQALNGGGEEDVFAMIRSPADAGRRFDVGHTPLHWAAGRGHLGLMRVLIRLGAPVDSANDFGNTPLHWAVSEGNVPAARLLLECGADVNRRGYGGDTPLHLAVNKKDRELAIALMSFGAAEHIRNDYGYAPVDKWREVRTVFDRFVEEEKRQDVQAIRRRIRRFAGCRPRYPSL